MSSQLDQCRRNRDQRKRIVNTLVPLITDPKIKVSWYTSKGKRLFDIAGATILLTLSFPLLLLVTIAVKLDSPGPVLFLQPRTGFLGRRFCMCKFRTMHKNAESMKEQLRHLSHHSEDSPDFKIVDDPRITRTGKWLRKSSLDELPNLFNVITGNMSLVGPRPTSFDFEKYHDNHLVRLAIKPGVTGLWQISGRSKLDFNQRVSLDRFYVENQSINLDIMILLKTPFKVLRGCGAC